MGFIFEKFDKTKYSRVYRENVPLRAEETIQHVVRLLDSLENLPFDSYVKIPHAVSSIFSDSGEMRMDIERSFDETDDYIEEEALLAPAEAAGDRFWRRKATRVTFLISHFFKALLLGKIVAGVELPAEFMAGEHTPEECDALRLFLAKGLAKSPQERFQSLKDLRSSLRDLQNILFLKNGILTSRELPKMKPKEAEIPNATAAQPQAPGDRFEILIWNHLFQNAARIPIELPARVFIGRKIGGENPSTARQGISPEDLHSKNPEIEQSVEQKEGCWHYSLAIAGDPCLSRKHAQCDLPADPSKTPWVQDLGSTHGIGVFQDASCDITAHSSLVAGKRVSFPSPQDQYLKLGNTYIRFRRRTEGQ